MAEDPVGTNLACVKRMPLGTTLVIVTVAVVLLALFGNAVGFHIALVPSLVLSLVLTLLVTGALALYNRRH